MRESFLSSSYRRVSFFPFGVKSFFFPRDGFGDPFSLFPSSTSWRVLGLFEREGKSVFFFQHLQYAGRFSFFFVFGKDLSPKNYTFFPIFINGDFEAFFFFSPSLFSALFSLTIARLFSILPLFFFPGGKGYDGLSPFPLFPLLFSAEILFPFSPTGRSQPFFLPFFLLGEIPP